MSLNWDEWRGSLDGKKTMWIKRLIQFKGFRLDLHKFVGSDDFECFHSHPAKAFRFVLWGGYIEQFENHLYNRMPMFSFGFIKPETVHRVSKLINGPSYSLWLRWPKTHKVWIVGYGWPKELRNKK